MKSILLFTAIIAHLKSNYAYLSGALIDTEEDTKLLCYE